MPARMITAMLVALLVPLSSCVQDVNSQLTPVTDPTKPLEFQGFSIRPPMGENWFIAEKSPTKVVFGKKTQTKTHTVLAGVDITSLPEGSPLDGLAPVTIETRKAILAGLARALENEARDSPRHTSLQIKVFLDDYLGSDCLGQEVTVEDHSVPEFPDSVFIMTGRTFHCLHPESPQFYIHLYYNQKIQSKLTPRW